MKRKLTDLKNIVDENLQDLDLSDERKKNLCANSNRSRKKKSKIKFLSLAAVFLCVVIVTSLLMFRNSNGVAYGKDLMRGVDSRKIETSELKDDFIKSTGKFSVDLFKQGAQEENALLSPISLYLALGMTANGADGVTLKEFEKVLGFYGLNLEDINSNSYSLLKELLSAKESKMNIANSIWFREEIASNIKKDFLQANSDYYGAGAYKENFNSKDAKKDINAWVNKKTNGAIEKAIENIEPNTLMYLINAVYYEGEWMSPYNKNDVKKGTFNLDDGSTVEAKFMKSTEYGYLEDEKVQGFKKSYKDGKYSFVALLPKEGISLNDYITSLKEEEFFKLLKNKKDVLVEASIPKFEVEYSKDLKDTLKVLGLNQCFGGEADLSKMFNDGSKSAYISDVFQKTHIEVNEKGTKAGAVTVIEIQEKSAPMGDEVKTIVLDKPFLYAIIENDTNLPIFIGRLDNPMK